jgi:hypothetical protein
MNDTEIRSQLPEVGKFLGVMVLKTDSARSDIVLDSGLSRAGQNMQRVLTKQQTSLI